MALRRFPRRIPLLRPLLAAGLLLGLGAQAFAAASGDFYRDVSRLNRILLEIDRRYVEEVGSRKITDAAVEGLRGVLDPHTAVFDPKDYTDLKVSTGGEFGGLGITIAIRDRVLTIISPLDGTPASRAGLQAGDRILSIDGKSTHGITADEAVEKLRGKVGTEVELEISREGLGEPMKVKLVRDKIQIHSVPYFGMVEGDVGYVKVNSFAKKTAEDLAVALEDLKGQGMKKLILDLRFNPGGLLEQAVEVSSLFLEKGKTIVSTRGRAEQSESRSESDPVLGSDVPVVVLVNGGSASAAEIVSGALQDWDRAVVMGDTTFGKGSVQTIFPLDNDGFALKLTTAFYYLPMGRCINRPENGVRGNRAEEEEEEDAEEEPAPAAAKEGAKADTARAKAPEKTFRTASGRATTGGGGIVPDVVVHPDTLNTVQYLLERHTMFFKFAVHYRPELEKRKIRVNENWKVPNDVLKAFQDFVAADTNFAKSKTRAESALTYFEETLQKELELERDSVGARPQLKEPIEKLRAALAERHKSALAADPEFLREGIKRELLGAFLGEKARAGYALKSDRPVQEAVKLLKDEAAFRKLLTPAPGAEKTSKEK